MTISRRAFLAGLGAASTALPYLSARAEDARLIELASRPPNYESLRSTFLHRITPIDRFYIRNHYDTPAIDRTAWRLKISGLAEQSLELSLADLERMPQTTVEAVLQCAGNGRALFLPRMPGVQWKRGAMGNAEWSGVRLADVLARAKPKAAVKYLKISGADRPVMPSAPAFLRGLPLDKAVHSDTLIALKMNGAALPALHGGPARLIVPGWVGDDWVKWLSELELRDTEPQGFFYETAYRFPEQPGAPGAPIAPEKMKPMTVLGPKSIIASLDQGQILSPGRHEIIGVAFSGEAQVEKLEITTDGGKSWRQAELEGPRTPYGFRRFRFLWRADVPGRYKVASRAADSSGRIQPESPVWNPSGYLYNAVDPIEVEVRA